MKLTFVLKGGAGSGNHGHAGIPGHQGGSQASGTSTPTVGKKRPANDYWPRYPQHIGVRDFNAGRNEHTVINSMLSSFQ